MVGVETGGAGVVGTGKVLVSNGRMSNGGAILVSNGEAASGGGAGGGAGVAAGGGGSSGDVGAGEEKVRNPRWMMHETVVLVGAKRKHDEEIGDEYVPAHKKWGAIAVDVKEKGVDRDARQCRKRWSNLYQDYRRIRDWLRSSGVESYWTMRHDKRRDNKLPGSFDSEVYENMDLFLSKKKGITPRTASDTAQPILDSEGGLGSETGADQDHDLDQDQDPDQDNLDLTDAAIGDGGSGSGSGSLPTLSGMEKEQANDSAADDRKKRHSKWTKHETVVLLVGKSNYDSKAKDLTASSKAIKSDEKWDNISAYCKSKGVDRDAQQCRKRWSNLHNGDYKKIREWQKRSDVESYWVMKSEDRRVNKLPGFFDPQVYEVMDKFCTKKGNGDLDGASPAFEELLLAEVHQKRDHKEAPSSAVPRKGKGGGDAIASPGDAPPSAPDSGNESRKTEQPTLAPAAAAAAESGGRKKRKRMPVSNGVLEASENHHQEMPTALASPTVTATTTTATAPTAAQAQAPAPATPAATPTTTKERDQKEQLITILESSVKAMQSVLAENIQSQIQAYKANSELDRIQRKQQGDNLVNVLTKLAEAMGKIADRL